MHVSVALLLLLQTVADLERTRRQLPRDASTMQSML